MSLSQLPFQVKAKIIKLYKQTNPDCPRLYDTLINVRVWHEALLSVYWKHTYIASMKTTDEEGEQGQGSRGWRRLDNFFAYGWRYVECLHLVDGCEQPTSEGTPELDIPLLQDKLDFLNNHKLPHLRAVTIPNVTLEFYITNLDGFLQSHKDDFEEIGVLKLLSEAVEAPLLISECAFEIFSRFRFTNLRKVFSDVAIQAAYLSDIVNLFPSSLTCLYLSEVVIDSIEDILVCTGGRRNTISGIRSDGGRVSTSSDTHRHSLQHPRIREVIIGMLVILDEYSLPPFARRNQFELGTMVSQLRRWDYRIDLSGLPNLEIFEVNGNFNRTLPIVFKTLLTLSAVPQLRSLSFTHAYCPDYAGILVKNFPNLESFRLSNWAMGNDQSRVAGAISVTLRGLPRLREFSVSFMHDFPMALSNADNVFGGARCHSLRRLDIPTTFFHAGSVLGVLSRMFPELEQLSICFSHLATIYRLGRSVRFPKLYKLLVNGAAVNTEMERMHFQNFISRFPCLRLCMILGCQNETIEALKLAFPNIIFWNHS